MWRWKPIYSQHLLPISIFTFFGCCFTCQKLTEISSPYVMQQELDVRIVQNFVLLGVFFIRLHPDAGTSSTCDWSGWFSLRYVFPGDVFTSQTRFATVMKLMLHRPLDLSQRVKVSLMQPDSGIYEHHVSFPAWSNVCNLKKYRFTKNLRCGSLHESSVKLTQIQSFISGQKQNRWGNPLTWISVNQDLIHYCDISCIYERGRRKRVFW